MGLFPLGLGPMAYMGLGISVPYISPPLDSYPVAGENQGVGRAF